MIRLATIFTILWIVLLFIYYFVAPGLFTRMFPHELGELLTGWFAPIAFVWVGVTVAMQRQELKHSSAALKLQSEQFKKSIDALERTNLVERSDRLQERLLLGMLRLSRASEHLSLRSPNGKTVSIATRLGSYREYSDFYRGMEVELAILKFGSGLTRIAEDLKAEWALNADSDVDELCVELTALGRSATDLMTLIEGVDLKHDITDVVPAAALRAFCNSVTSAHDVLYEVEHPADTMDEVGG